MTLLGRRNPIERITRSVCGWLKPPKRSWPPPPAGVLVIGHRGAAKFAAENTVASFQKAVELGADAVEADVCVTREARFVLWHDADPNEKVALLRQIGAEELLYMPAVPPIGSPWRKKVCELSLQEFVSHYSYSREVQAVAGQGSNGDARACVSLLEDLLAWALGEKRLRAVVLDIKLDEHEQAAARALLDRARDFCLRPDFREGLELHLLSPQREIVEALLAQERARSLPPAIRLYADFELPGVLDFARRLGARNVSLGHPRRTWASFRQEFAQVLKARHRGTLERVVAWTVNKENHLKQLVRLGPDGILTDEISLLRGVVVEEGSAPRDQRLPERRA